uniref:Uncharacterized protein n=1 Tax=Anguilla anguilla TaxID=7936 RepID=A0A0E9TNC1_ANGAN
MMKFLSISA